MLPSTCSVTFVLQSTEASEYFKDVAVTFCLSKPIILFIKQTKQSMFVPENDYKNKKLATQIEYFLKTKAKL